jgi:hypothetical protein
MVVGIFIDCEDSNKKKAEYVFKHVFNVLGIPCQLSRDDIGLTNSKSQINIYYGRKGYSNQPSEINPRGLIINISSCILSNPLPDWHLSLPAIDYISPDVNDKTPVFYNHGSVDSQNGETLYKYSSDGKPAIQVRKDQKGTVIDIGFDIIMSAFFLLSRLEEIISKPRDVHQRYSANQSLALLNGFLHQPVVDKYVGIFQKLLNLGRPSGVKLEPEPLWPDKKEFAVCLTHDIDTISTQTPREFFARSFQSARFIVRMRFREAREKVFNALKPIFQKQSPQLTFKTIIDLEKTHGFKSSFYFCGGGKGYQIDYDLRNKNIVDIIHYIQACGWEIGMHGSYDSYNNKELLLAEKTKLETVLGRNVSGIRQHFLRFDPSKTWHIQSEVGLKYDVSLGYPDQTGFRAGTTLPFYPYGFVDDTSLPILEMPLVFDDTSLFEYLQYNPQQALDHAKLCLDTVKKYHGVCVLLWHHDDFKGYERRPQWGEVYSKLLDHLSRQNAWVTSGEEITAWWTNRKHRIEKSDFSRSG